MSSNRYPLVIIQNRILLYGQVAISESMTSTALANDVRDGSANQLLVVGQSEGQAQWTFAWFKEIDYSTSSGTSQVLTNHDKA